MILTIVIPADLDWLIRLVRDQFTLIRQAYPGQILTSEIDLEGKDIMQPESTQKMQSWQKLPTVTLEQAREVTNNDGIRYGEIDAETLGRMEHFIAEKLTKEGKWGYSEGEREGMEFKLAAIHTLLAKGQNESL